ncbi:hypothetical protein BHM03_00042296 [Ensete ventricosum]|nr:hypothetical protein BHM03_00042296 [Ensete ventricosum]
MYMAIAEEGYSSMEQEIAAVVFNLLLAAIMIVSSERLGRQQIDGSAAWWGTMETTSKAIVGIAWEGGSMDDGYRGSTITALIPDDRTPDGAL